MQTKTVDVDSLNNDPRNARAHPVGQLEQLQASLRRFGQVKPIVITPDGQVVAGHGVLAAARAEGWLTVEAVVTGLVGAERTAFAVADNRLAELSSWDYQALATLGPELTELDGLGFTAAELSNIMALDFTPPPESEPPAPDEKGIALKFSAAEWAEIKDALGVDNPGDAAARIMALVRAE